VLDDKSSRTRTAEGAAQAAGCREWAHPPARCAARRRMTMPGSRWRSPTLRKTGRLALAGRPVRWPRPVGRPSLHVRSQV